MTKSHIAGRTAVITMTLVVSATVGAHAALAADDWVQRASDIDGEAADDQSGRSVALSSDGLTVAIGAPYNDENGSSSGQVRVFSFVGDTWVQRGSDIDGEAAGDLSGSAVALSSDGLTVAIGAPYNDGNGSDSGQVRIYDWDGSAWSQRGQDIDGEAAGDLSGSSVSLSSDGSVVAVGAPFNAGNGSKSGQVRIYDWEGAAWSQRGADIDGEAADDWSGYSVALSSDGSTVAIGAPYNDGNGLSSGQVRVYAWNGTAWVQQGNAIDGEAAGDQSGWSVALSSDGLTVAIGAQNNDGNGTASGQVRVFSFVGDTWVQRGSDIDGEAAGDLSGYAVALSSDGLTVAIGAPYNDGNGTDSGQVRVFAWPTASSGVIPGPVTEFTFFLPDGRECSSISPQRVQVGTMQVLPGEDALCQTSEGSLVAGWAIPVQPGFTGYGSVHQPFPPGLPVRVIESQRFTVVPYEQVLQVDYDSNIASQDSCTPANVVHGSEDGRVGYSWVPRSDFAMARTPAQAPCAPDGHSLVGWNTTGDGSGVSVEPGAMLPQEWQTGPTNHHTLFAVWTMSQ